MGNPRGLPEYMAGTVTVTNGSQTVTGAGTLWIDPTTGDDHIAAGDMLRVGNQRPILIESVDSATGLTLVEPWPHATASNTAYRAIRYVPLPSSQVVAAINQVLPMLGNSWVTPTKLADAAVTAAKLADAAVTPPKLSTGGPSWFPGNLIVSELNQVSVLRLNGGTAQSYLVNYGPGNATYFVSSENLILEVTGVAPKTIFFNIAGAQRAYINETGIGGNGSQLTNVVVPNASITPAKLIAGGPSWDASGHLYVLGNAYFGNGGGVDGFSISATGGIGYTVTGHASSVATGNWYSAYYWGGNYIGGVSQNGTTGVSYNTTSDERLKTIEGPIQSAAIINALDPFMHSWTSDPDQGSVPGLSAQAAYAVAPYAVTPGKGEPGDADFIPWSADWARLVPVLIAEVKALRVRVAALEARPSLP